MTRVCPEHACDLIDDGPLAGACPEGMHFPEEWDVFSGPVMVCQIRGDWRVIWCAGFFDGRFSRKIAGREADGTGGRPFSIDIQQSQMEDRKREANRRMTERERAKREGRAPKAWAVFVEEAEA